MENGQSYTTAEVEMQLGINRPALKKLVACGLLPEGTREGRVIRYPSAPVDALSMWEAPPTNGGGALVVHMGTPARDPWADRWIGWNEEWSEATKREAARGVWQIADPDARVGRALVAAVSTFTVGAWLITGYIPGRYTAFELAEITPDEVRRDWENKRIEVKPGSLISYRDGDRYFE